MYKFVCLSVCLCVKFPSWVLHKVVLISHGWNTQRLFASASGTDIWCLVFCGKQDPQKEVQFL